MTKFRDRAHAAVLLAERARGFETRKDPLILALPRGGVPIGHGVATLLGVDLDVLVVRKVSRPQEPELALGAVAFGGVQVLNRDLIAQTNVDGGELIPLIQTATDELSRRENLYRKGRPTPRVRGRSVMIADDGIATGATVLAAIRAIRSLHPHEVIVGVPVAPVDTIERLEWEADEVIAVVAADDFRGVSQFYEGFDQVSDEEVCKILREAWTSPVRAGCAVPSTT